MPESLATCASERPIAWGRRSKILPSVADRRRGEGPFAGIPAPARGAAVLLPPRTTVGASGPSTCLRSGMSPSRSSLTSIPGEPVGGPERTLGPSSIVGPSSLVVPSPPGRRSGALGLVFGLIVPWDERRTRYGSQFSKPASSEVRALRPRRQAQLTLPTVLSILRGKIDGRRLYAGVGRAAGRRRAGHRLPRAGDVHGPQARYGGETRAG